MSLTINKNDLNYLNALAFGKVALEINNRNINNSRFQKEHNFSQTIHMIPCAVNLTFSIELYFKYIYTLSNLVYKPRRKKSRHSLVELYTNLPHKLKIILAKKTKIIEDIKSKEGENFRPKTFRTYLVPLDLVFLEWRYIHETLEIDQKKSICLPSGFLILNAVNFLVQDLRKAMNLTIVNIPFY